MRVAFPGTIQGFKGELSFHFGHAMTFAIVDYDPELKEISQVQIVRNVSHQHGKCMRPVRLLMTSNIQEIVVGGIGRRPLLGLKQLGIRIFQGIEGTIKENFILLLEDKLTNFLEEGGCKQGDNCDESTKVD